MDDAQIRDAVRGFILDQFLPGESAEAIDDSTPLITGGILDSISTIKLVAYLEDEFGVQFDAHEMSADYLDSTSRISEVVREKLGS